MACTNRTPKRLLQPGGAVSSGSFIVLGHACSHRHQAYVLRTALADSWDGSLPVTNSLTRCCFTFPFRS